MPSRNTTQHIMAVAIELLAKERDEELILAVTEQGKINGEHVFGGRATAQHA